MFKLDKFRQSDGGNFLRTEGKLGMPQHLQRLQFCIREDAPVQIQVTGCDADKIFLICITNISNYMITIIALCLHVLCDQSGTDLLGH